VLAIGDRTTGDRSDHPVSSWLTTEPDRPRGPAAPHPALFRGTIDLMPDPSPQIEPSAKRRRPTTPERPRLTVVRAMNRRGIRLLHVADLLLVYVLLFAITLAMMQLRPGFNAQPHLSRYLWTYALVAVIHLIVFSFGGLYDRERRLVVRPSTSRVLTLVWIASLVVGLTSWLMSEFLIPRTVLISYALIGPFGLWLNRWISRRLRAKANGPARLLLVGRSSDADRAEQHLAAASAQVITVGRTDDVRDLEQRAIAAGATDVLVLDGDSLERLYADSLSRLEAHGIEVLQLIQPHNSLLGLRTVGEVGGMPVVSLSAHVLTTSQQRVKRWMDLAVLIVTSPVTIPLGLLTTVIVAVRAGRPLLFIQDRVGRDGATFPMLKFRTMRPDAETTGPVQAAVDDPRIIRGLGWLRSARLDELPQLINVLLGQMTIVGPRPERPEEMVAYEQMIPGYRRRHQIEPGITGLAQVYGHYHTHPEFKLGHDLQYLANWSPLVDLQIMIRTAWVIITRRL
jgi:exopolysaccharide biosynthesis polyprenyl glycosylphosphotransferase